MLLPDAQFFIQPCDSRLSDEKVFGNYGGVLFSYFWGEASRGDACRSDCHSPRRKAR